MYTGITKILDFEYKTDIDIYFFTYNRNIHSYPTRTRNNIHLNNPKTLIAHKSLKHHGPDIWNNLPQLCKTKSILKSVKKNLKQLLLKKYLK